MKGTATEKDRERREIFHLLVLSPNSCNSQGRQSWEPAAWVSRTGAGAQGLGPPFTVPPHALPGRQPEARQPEPEPEPTRDASVPATSLDYNTRVLAPDFSNVKRTAFP